MPDYDCYPTWVKVPDGMDNVAPASLPISAGLAGEIDAWGARYDAILNRDDPASTDFASAEDEHDFEETGLRLWKALREELGPTIEVTYFSQKEQRELRP